jgi:hypothetical protein
LCENGAVSLAVVADPTHFVKSVSMTLSKPILLFLTASLVTIGCQAEADGSHIRTTADLLVFDKTLPAGTLRHPLIFQTTPKTSAATLCCMKKA